MSTENELQLPVIDGEVSFPRLEMAEILQWANELKARRRIEAEQRMKADNTLSSFERQRLLQLVDDREIELDHVLIRSYTPTGILYVLNRSLAKAKKTPAEAKDILARIHFKRQAEIAQQVMSAPEPVAAQTNGDGTANPPPNDTAEISQEISP